MLTDRKLCFGRINFPFLPLLARDILSCGHSGGNVDTSHVFHHVREAEQMAKKADAWKEYKEAALVDMMLKVLPQVAAEVSAPLAQTDKITMVSTGDGPIGASRVTGEVLDIMNSLPNMVKNMIGVDISSRMAAA
jgi:hypothetical protein